jgi:hypothetical protein
LGCKLEDIIHASGKTILAAIIEKIPLQRNVDEPLQALILTLITIRFVVKLFR